MIHYLNAWFFLGTLLLADTALAVSMPSKHTSPVTPRNVILLIGDGMDDHQISIARNYLHGADGRLLLDEMPVRAAVGVITVEDSEGGGTVYVADSANTATSMATGAVTSRGRIATTPGSDEDLVTLVELAAAAGYRTGIVTTASVTDATPAAFASHVSLRLCEGPDTMVDIRILGVPMGGCPADLKANGGRGSIAEQLAASPLDVILGGGRKHFEQRAEGESGSVLEQARRQGFQTVLSPGELVAVSDGRILGVFARSTLPVRLRGEDDRRAEAPKSSLMNRVFPYFGSVTLPRPMRCEPNPQAAAVPGLQQMTDAALSLLSRSNDRGFFLMVESASIDKQAHERSPCGSIGEVQQLEEALASALDFAAEHPGTLVLVTSDHTHAAQLVPEQSLYAAYGVPIYTPGRLARVITPRGDVLAVNYATNNFSHEEHTGANVPLFANEEGRARVRAYLTQPELFTVMLDYLQLQPTGPTD